MSFSWPDPFWSACKICSACSLCTLEWGNNSQTDNWVWHMQGEDSGLFLSFVFNQTEIIAATLVERGCLSITPAHLVVVLAALLHGWIIGAIVFLCKTTKQKIFVIKQDQWGGFFVSGCLALTRNYAICLARLCLVLSKIGSKLLSINQIAQHEAKLAQKCLVSSKICKFGSKIA